MKSIFLSLTLFPLLCGASFWVANIPSDARELPAQTCEEGLEHGLSFLQTIPSPPPVLVPPIPEVSTVSSHKRLPAIYNKGKRIKPTKFLPDQLSMQPLEGSYKDIARIGKILRKAPTQRTRLTFFGASHTEGEFWTGHIRRVLQSRYGDLGHGFVMPTPLFDGMRSADLNLCSTEDWNTGFVGRQEIVDDPYYGLGMRSISDDPSQFAWVETTHSNPHGRSVSIFEVLTLKQPGGGSLLVTLDDEESLLFPTLSETHQLNRLRIDTFDGAHRLTLNPLGDGPVRLFGLSMERTGTGALIDAIGIRGRTIRTWKYWDQTLFADMMDTLDPNIVVIAYGTNEASDPDYSMEQYRTDLRKNLTMLQKSRPDQACILVGPSDRGKSKGKRSFYVWSQTARVASVQREVAPEFGCVFWDWQQAQGGEGAMIAWRYTNPPLAAKDLLHHTPQGYVHMAEQFIKALDDAAQHYR
jgi:hypothetical protein